MPRLFTTKVIILILFVTLVDISAVPLFFTGSLRPILGYLLVLYVSFEWHWSKSLPMAMMVGLVRDLLSIQFFGMEVLSLGLAAFMLNFLIQKTAASSWAARIFGCFIYVTAALILISMFHVALGESFVFTWRQAMQCLATAMVTTLFMPILFPVIRLWLGDRAIRSALL